MRLLSYLVTITLTALLATAAAQGLSRDVRLNILQSVVQIIPYDIDNEELVNWSGSGTIISPSGYVLTNYHVAGDLDTRRHFEWHTIWVTDPDFTDQPPEATFWARFIAGDPTHDLALLKIEEWIDEEPVDPNTVFPHVVVGDSNLLIPGDPITIVGYPGISGSTVTFTAGLMSGWLGEDFEGGGKQWIKTDGKIAHGNSGGGAFDENGHLIGVPTAGRTVKYDELDTEEQAYVRPISLGWALLGPNVPDVARAISRPPVATPAQPATQEQASSESTELPSSGVGPCDFCFAGELTLGRTVSAVIGGIPDMVNYHSYSVDISSAVTELIIELDSDHDLDIAVKYGSPIESWGDEGDWEFRDYSDDPGASFTIPLPTPGTWYLDVMMYYPSGATNYTLIVK